MKAEDLARAELRALVDRARACRNDEEASREIVSEIRRLKALYPAAWQAVGNEVPNAMPRWWWMQINRQSAPPPLLKPARRPRARGAR